MLDAMSERYTDERRRSFDKVAAAYDAIRPSYPEAAIDDILERSQAVRALEVGAGTGKATVARFMRWSRAAGSPTSCARRRVACR
jgi:predicted transcriptional regulator